MLTKSSFLKTKTAFLLLLLGLFFSQELSAQNWSLKRCVDYAKSHNIQLRQQHINSELSSYDLKQSKFAQLPNLTATVGHSFNYGRFIDPTTNNYISESSQTGWYQLNSSVPIFQGLQLRNTIKRNKLNVELNTLDSEALEDEISLQVVQAYLTVLLNQAALEVAETTSQTTREQYLNSKKLVDAGVLPEGDLLDIEAQKASDNLAIVQASNNLDIAYLQLRLLMQYEEEQDFQVGVPDAQTINDLLVLREYDVQHVYDYAAANMAGLMRGPINIETTEQSLRIAKSGLWPNLSLFGQFQSNYSDVAPFSLLPNPPEADPFLTQLDNNQAQAWGLNLSVPIFNNWSIRQNIKYAEVNYLNAQLQHEQALNDLRQVVEQLVADLNSAAKSYEANLKLVEARSNAFDFTEKKYNAGQSNTFDYTTAKNNLAIAETNLIQSRFQYLFSIKSLDFYMGRPLSFE